MDAEKLQLTVDISDAELKSRKDAWKQPPLPVIWMAKKDPGFGIVLFLSIAQPRACHLR